MQDVKQKKNTRNTGRHGEQTPVKKKDMFHTLHPNIHQKILLICFFLGFLSIGSLFFIDWIVHEHPQETQMDDYISKPINAELFQKKLFKNLTDKVANDGTHRMEETEQQEVLDNRHPVDLVHMRMFTDGDQIIEKELFTIFVTQAELNIQSLEDYSDGDEKAEKWRKAAHKFKGAAANLGAHTLSEICFTAEKEFEKGTPNKQQILGAIKEEYINVKEFLERNVML